MPILSAFGGHRYGDPMGREIEERRRVRVEFPVTPEQVLLVLLAVAAGFFAVSLVLGLRRQPTGFEESTLLRYLSLDRDHSLPTWFSASVLLGAAVLALAASTGAGWRRRLWWVLSAFLLVMSADEVVQAHQQLGDRIHDAYDTHGLLYFAFGLPGAVIVVAAVVAFAPLVRRLEPTTRRVFVAGAAVYVLGALLIEAVNGAVSDSIGQSNNWYVLGTNVEELCEMVGACLVVYALTRQVSGSTPG